MLSANVLSVIAAIAASTTPGVADDAERLTFSVSKWAHHKPAAATINIDGPVTLDGATGEALRRNLKTAYELSTWGNTDLTRYISILASVPPGLISFFGHGDEHVSHDRLPPLAAEASFRTNRELMGHAGLDTRAYAYPEGRGYRPETQLALARAGYMLGRGVHFRNWGERAALICPDEEPEPRNWYLLPGVLVAERDEAGAQMFDHAATRRLMRSAVEHNAWIVLLYHSIGNPDYWGYYPAKLFRSDLDFIAASPFWVDHLENVGCYILERQRVQISSTLLARTESTVVFTFSADDKIPEDVCAHPLTVDISVQSREQFSWCSAIGPMQNPTFYPVENNSLTMELVPDGKVYQLSCSHGDEPAAKPAVKGRSADERR